jgi:hypothetical protein
MGRGKKRKRHGNRSKSSPPSGDAPTTAAKVAKQKWWKLILGNLLVLAVLLLITGTAGEIYYRFIVDTTDSFSLTRVCDRWFKRHYEFNRAGARDNIEYLPERNSALRRITFLGDSFTAGHGIRDVEQRFTNRIRRSLGRGWEVHTLAANGLDTGAEVQSLTNYVQGGYELETLVLVYALNDISDIVPEWADILQRIYGYKQNEGFWVKKSFFINTLYYRFKASHDPDVSHYYDFLRGAYDSYLWEVQTNRLRSLKDLCDSKGARLMVVTFPFLHSPGPDYAYEDIHGRLEAFWDELGVANLDLRDLYLPYSPGELVIGKYDAHPNEFAHGLAAEEIERFLSESM